jgi:hypothetical protein
MSLRIRRYRVTHVMRCFAALLFFMPAATPLQAQGFQLDPPRGPVPPVYFGLHIHHLWQDTGWPDIPFGTWRLWDAHVLWAYLEPSPGKYDFELLDRYVQVANQHGVELVLTLQGPPTWASARPAEVPVHQGGGKGLPGSAAEPKSFSTWEDFVRAVASRYRGKIKYYELWNEPMSRPYFSGTPEQMVALAKSASAILKQIDPENKLLSPPVSGDSNGLEWLSKFLSAGGGQYVDIYGFHFYVGGVPEQAIPKVQSARVLLRQFGQDQKPMWNTEAGWQISQLAPSVAADYVARALLLGWPLELGRYVFYSWDHPQMGIAPEGNSNTPMVRAYASVERWLTGSVVTRCLRLPNGMWVEDLTFKDGLHGKVVWAQSGTVPLSIDNIGNATEYVTLDGQATSIRAGTVIEASGSPILLYSSAGGR